MNTQLDYILVILLYVTSSRIFAQIENYTPAEPPLDSNSNSEPDWCSKDICSPNETSMITRLGIKPLKKLSEHCPFLFPYGIFRIRICCETHEFLLLWNIFEIVMKSMDKCKQCLESYKNLLCHLAVHIKSDIMNHPIILYDSNIKFLKK